GKPDLLETYPAHHATNVPTNATLTAHYSSTAEYLEEEVTLEHVGVSEADPFPVTFNEAEGLLQLKHPDGLVAGDMYILSWPALRGIGTASLGASARIEFTVGDGEDTSAPDFDGLDRLTWDVDHVRDDCTGSLEERFVFEAWPGQAHDDFGEESLALVVFQTK